MTEMKWEFVCGDAYATTHRMAIPGGWLYRIITLEGAVTATYVVS